MNPKSVRRIGLIGFGEVGGIFGQDLAAAGFHVGITDILLRDDGSRERMLEKARRAKVEVHDSLQSAICSADLIISAVTALAAADVANEAAAALSAGQVFLDMNSVSPEKKREIARVIGMSKATFVEAAAMAPVHPQGIKVPMLLGGSDASQVAAMLGSIGMNAKAVSDRIGVASAIKMCRSVIVKGLEALAVESMFAARQYGAEQEVLASLAASYPEMGWKDKLPDYLISRVAQHGRRRAAEMREVAGTLGEVGLDPWMALATAKRQDWLVTEMTKRDIPYSGGSFSWIELADRIAAAQESAVSVRSEDQS
jgi:3-hydroxyisobutyrate dehydrogenase-like beta-hydroxyacid dehydrogenase